MLVLSNPRVVEFASGLRVEEDLVIGTTGLGSFASFPIVSRQVHAAHR